MLLPACEKPRRRCHGPVLVRVCSQLYSMPSWSRSCPWYLSRLFWHCSHALFPQCLRNFVLGSVLFRIMRIQGALILFSVLVPSACGRLRRVQQGKEAEMEDVLQVANTAHQAAQIYAQEKKSRSKDQAAKDIYLVLCLFPNQRECHQNFMHRVGIARRMHYLSAAWTGTSPQR